jgi:hypothetical protein
MSSVGVRLSINNQASEGDTNMPGVCEPFCGTKCSNILTLMATEKVCVGKTGMISIRWHKLAEKTYIQKWDKARTHDIRPSLDLLQHKQHLCKFWEILLCHTKCKKTINSSSYPSYIKISNAGGMLAANSTDPYTNNIFESGQHTWKAFQMIKIFTV